MEKWYIEVKRADFDGIAKRFHISPVVARLLRNRDVIGDEQIDLFLNGKKEDLYDPFLMADMEKAVMLVRDYLQEGKKIRIIGDYDIDGICSAFILQKGFSFLAEKAGRADCIDVVIPHRIEDGYGLNDRLITQAGEDGIEVIVTCDNGIAAGAQIAYAKKLGISVIVTDHHEVPFEQEGDKRRYLLPEAEAVVDPKREDCSYPFKGICGGVVAYKLILGLVLQREKEGCIEKEETKALLDECFAFAAFATVGDVMELKDENHVLVKHGLKAIASSSNFGLQALIEQCGLKDKELTTYHIGFILGPCFNASGRLDSAERILELLHAPSKREAMVIARELREINAKRQELTGKGLEEAIELVEKQGLSKDRVLVVYLPDVHESLAGIIAGRLRERYGKPVFVLTDGEEGIKGSGRSIDAYHMYEEMTKVKDIFLKFGGHKMAAGLSLPKGSAEEFRKRINSVCTLQEEDFVERIMIDVPMPIDYVSADLLSQMQCLKPYGTGNKEPSFAQKGVILQGFSLIGKQKNVAKGRVVSDGGVSFEGIYFKDSAAFMEKIQKYGNKADIIYTPEENTFRGQTSIQIVIKYIKFPGEETI
ncbi:MAG: single-stranded-DNA-specific exonuclease RecJ [Lachnospiraceae bacterium]|nr:single-stranded-DNA-specific exonuclease RecJ [Lachnospiraceae bacterium]